MHTTDHSYHIQQPLATLVPPLWQEPQDFPPPPACSHPEPTLNLKHIMPRTFLPWYPFPFSQAIICLLHAAFLPPPSDIIWGRCREPIHRRTTWQGERRRRGGNQCGGARNHFKFCHAATPSLPHGILPAFPSWVIISETDGRKMCLPDSVLSGGCGDQPASGPRKLGSYHNNAIHAVPIQPPQPEEGLSVPHFHPPKLILTVQLSWQPECYYCVSTLSEHPNNSSGQRTWAGSSDR